VTPAVPELVGIVRHAKSVGNVAEDEGFLTYPDDQQAAWAYADALLREQYPHITNSDWPLVPEGEEEAATLRKRIPARFPDGFDEYYVSTMRRAQETFAIGLPDRTPKARSPLLNEFRGHSPEDYRRVQEFFDQMCREHSGQRVLVVGHGNWIKSIVEVPPPCVMIPLSMAWALNEPLANTAITVFHRDTRSARLVLTDYNFTK